jgi:restriction system protein
LAEIHQVATDDIVKPLPEEEDDRPPFFQDVSEKANELISDLVSRPAPYDFQDLVAAVPRAMGYKAVSSPPGRDRGIDIAVHPDTLGFERPRIKVQVKHRKEPTKGPEMRSFLGRCGPVTTAFMCQPAASPTMPRWKQGNPMNQSQFWTGTDS